MDRVMEIVNYVMKQLFFQGENNCSERDLMNTLSELGYSLEEIRNAFKLLYSLPDSLKTTACEYENLMESQHGHRILSPLEQQKLSFACQGEIFRLMNTALLTPHELERILIEAVQMDIPEIGLSELEKILHKVVIDEERLLLLLPQPIELTSSLLPN